MDRRFGGHLDNSILPLVSVVGSIRLDDFGGEMVTSFSPAELPSSFCSLKGKLIVSPASYGEGTQVNAKTYIPGQVYDWGKSQRCLEQMCQELVSDLGLPATISRRAS